MQTYDEFEDGAAVVQVGPFSLRLGPDAWLSRQSARYSLERLWALAGGGSDYRGPAMIHFEAASSAAVETLLDTASRVTWLPLQQILPEEEALGLDTDSLPAPLLRDRAVPFQVVGKHDVIASVDLASFAFLMLSRWEESHGQTYDDRNRFPAEASLAHRHGFLDRPVIDEWAIVLSRWVMALDARWEPIPSSFRVLLTHDIDAVRRFPHWIAVLKFAAGAILRRRDIAGARRQLQEGSRALRNWRLDPYYKGVTHLMAVSERYGLRSAFYFKTSDKGRFDTGYVISDEPAISMLREIQTRDHEIGFHPGYDTFDDEELLRTEKRRLDSVVTGAAVTGGRQHNLRFAAPATWRSWQNVGLTYDSTVGYADYAGFRCGTCHPFPVYDWKADEPLTLLEVPLIVMENTLFSKKYMALEGQDARATILLLANRCRRVGGVMTLLWHNTSFDGAFAAQSLIYEDVIRELACLSGAHTETAIQPGVNA